MADDIKTPDPAAAEPTEEKTVETDASQKQVETKETIKAEIATLPVPEIDKATETPKAIDESSLETTTANDGNISINKTETSEPTVDPMPDTTSVLPETPAEPVVVKAEDVQAVEPPENEKLQEEIESLTGEIQALEAKIERLTSGSTAPSVDATTPEKPVIEIEKPTELIKPVENIEIKKEEPAPFMTPPTAIPAAQIPTVKPVSDIYSNIGKPRPPMDPSVQDEPSHPSAVAVISEVLVVLGTILFVILAATPLFREMVGEDLYQVIRSVGWLTTAATLLLGTLMAVFGKGKAAITLIGFVFLLLSAFMYTGMNYPSLLGPLESSLSSIFNFYR